MLILENSKILKTRKKKPYSQFHFPVTVCGKH